MEVLALANSRRVRRDGPHLNLEYDYPGAECFSDAAVFTPILDTVCDSLKLAPRSLWWEALRVDFISRIQYRIPQFSGKKWKEVETLFANKSASKADELVAAWLLVFDAWLYFQRGYVSRNKSPFARLGSLTKNSTSASLRLAHCVRDLSFGNFSRELDFFRMIDSQDPEFRPIFKGIDLARHYPNMNSWRRRLSDQRKL